jgi:hypothetical protein
MEPNLITYNLTGCFTYSEKINQLLGFYQIMGIYYANRSINESKPFWLIKFNPSGEIWHKNGFYQVQAPLLHQSSLILLEETYFILLFNGW